MNDQNPPTQEGLNHQPARPEVSPDGPEAPPEAGGGKQPPARRKFPWAMLVVVAIFVIVPFLSWYGTWFGRPLSDDTMEEYLNDKEKPRNVQHALSQIAARIVEGDESVKRWYPSVEAAVEHPEPVVRLTAAWVMGQDTARPEFHRALLRLVNDSDPGVRHNAALALVRFGDASGRSELVAMLQPMTLDSGDAAGEVELLVDREGAAVPAGAPVVRIKRDDGQSVEIRAPEAGHIEFLAVSEGSRVGPGARLVVLSPSIEQVWEALRALYLVGQPDDISHVQRYTRELPGMPYRIREQAASTVEAIRARSGTSTPA